MIIDLYHKNIAGPMIDAWIIVMMIVLFLSGILISTLGAMTGLGGGFLAVPYLILFWGLNRPDAVLASLFMIFANSTSGTIAYVKSRMIRWSSAAYLFIPTIPGLVIGYLILISMDASLFDLIFSVLLISVTIYIVYSRTRDDNNEREDEEEDETNIWKKIVSAPVAFVAGIISSTFGIGGGAIFMPLQIGLLGIRIKKAIATSMLIIAMMAFIRVFIISASQIDLLYSLPLALGGLIGGQIGAKVVKKIKRSEILLYLLGLFLVFIGLYMGVNGVLGLV